MSEHVAIPRIGHATQQMREWLDDLGARPPFTDHRQAYSLLRAVLHALRDRLTAEGATRFGEQLPMVVRGFYFEGWRPVAPPSDFRTVEAFLQRVRSCLGTLPREREIDLEAAARTVIDFLCDRLDEGAMREVAAELPDELAALFPEPEPMGWGGRPS